MQTEMRIGTGWDSHTFAPGRTLWLGGVRVEHPEGLAGHSDGDVLLHAICDALLGALGEGDIGSHFPSSDAQWAGAGSAQFVEHARALTRKAGWRILNLDATLILAQPRLDRPVASPLRTQMRERVAALLETAPERISIKGKTPEGLAGGDTAIALATVLLGAV